MSGPDRPCHTRPVVWRTAGCRRASRCLSPAFGLLVMAVQMITVARGKAAFQAQHPQIRGRDLATDIDPTPRNSSPGSVTIIPRSGSASRHAVLSSRDASRGKVGNPGVRTWLRLKCGDAKDWLASQVNSVLGALGRAPAFKIDPVRKIMRTMDMHPANATIQREACVALRRLSTNATAKVSVVAAGGIQRVLSAIMVHGGDAAVAGTALDTLSSLAAGNRDNALVIADADIITISLGAMDTHCDIPDVAFFACAVLKLFSASDAEADRIIRSGGIGRVAAAIVAHAQNAGVQEVALETLWLLAKAGSPRTLGDDVGEIISAMSARPAHRCALACTCACRLCHRSACRPRCAPRVCVPMACAHGVRVVVVASHHNSTVLRQA